MGGPRETQRPRRLRGKAWRSRARRNARARGPLPRPFPVHARCERSLGGRGLWPITARLSSPGLVSERVACGDARHAFPLRVAPSARRLS